MKQLTRPLPAPKAAGVRFLDVDGTETAVFVERDVVELFHGRTRMQALSIDPKIMVKVSWFVLRWWIFSRWFGLR